MTVSGRLVVNPVLARELRQRVRSRRASVVLTVYLSLLVACVGLLVWGFQRTATEGSTVTQGIGRTLLGSLLFVILGLVCFIVPGVAAGSVAGERERLTLMPLQVTLLTPGQILRGKLLASLAFTTLLLVAALPLLAVAYVLGGITVPQIAGGLFLVLASAAFLGVLSIWASTVLRRVQRATVAAYGMVGVLVIGTLFAYGLQVLFTATADDQGNRDGWESLLVMSVNPFLVTADALGHSRVSDGGASPFTPSQEALRRRDERRGGRVIDGVEVTEGMVFDNNGVPLAPTPPFGFNGPSATIVQAPPATAVFGPTVPRASEPFTAPIPAPAVAVPAPASAPAPAQVEPVPASVPGPQSTIPTGMPVPSPTTMPDFRSGGPVIDPSIGGPGFVPGPPGFEPRGGVFPPGPPGFEPSGGVFPQGGRPMPQRAGGDLTDWGPIWLWTFGWWILLGGSAYAHASRRLRLPSLDGVRP